MKPTKEKSDANGGVNVDNSDEDSEDYYSAEYSPPPMDAVDLELLERFLQMLEESSDSDDVNYGDQSSKPDVGAHPENASSSGTNFSLLNLWS